MVCDGLAWVGVKLYVPESQQVMAPQKCHDSKTVGYFVKTLHLAKCQFWWQLLKKDIESYIASCPMCASAKRRPGKTLGLLQPIATSQVSWKEMSMDFIVELREYSALGDNRPFLKASAPAPPTTLKWMGHVNEIMGSWSSTRDATSITNKTTGPTSFFLWRWHTII